MKGLVRIRLARFGRKHQPLYNIVVAKARTARDKVPIEVIGTYNPVPNPLTEAAKARGEKPVKDVKLDFDRAKYWLAVGAQPSETVVRLFKKGGVLHPEWPSPVEIKNDPKREIVAEKTAFVEEQS